MKYNPALDGLRALAVLAVIGYHVGIMELNAGYLGVDVFFVLSGYLITSILLREHEHGGIRLGQFYLRRARRLYPALCVLVALLLALQWIQPRGALTVLAYLSDYVGPPGALGHTWSLAVEEHYYLLWPLLLPFVARLPRRSAMWLLFAVYVAASVWSTFNTSTIAATQRFDTRMSGLVFGSLLAFLPATSLAPFGLLLVATAMLGFGIPADRMFTETATASIILLSTQCTLPWVTRQPFIYIGRISYGMYLFHAPVAFWVLGEMGWQARLSVTLGISGGLAALSYHTIERYFREPCVSDSEAQPQAA